MNPEPRIILFFDHTAAWGGGEVSLFFLVTHLDPARFRPVVFLGEDGPLATRLREAGIDLHILPLPATVGQARKDTLGARSTLRVRAFGEALRYCWRLRGFIRRLRPALVFTNSLKADLLGGLAARLASARLLWCVRDRIADDYLPARVAVVFRWLARWLPHAVVANSRATLATLQFPTAYIGTRAHTVHPGVLIPPPPAKRPRTAKCTAGIIGRLTAWKGQEIFLRAIAMVRVRLPEARFLIVGSALFGEDEYEAHLRRLSADLDLESCVEFAGFRSDMPQVLESLDVVVHASTSAEPFGRVVAEGMAAGKTVIASRGGGVLEMIEDGVNGLLVPIGDVPALAAALEQVFADVPLRKRLGENARAYAYERLSVQRMVAEMSAVFDSIIPPLRERRPAASHPLVMEFEASTGSIAH